MRILGILGILWLRLLSIDLGFRLDSLQRQSISLRNNKCHVSPFEFFLAIEGKTLKVTSCHFCIFESKHDQNSKCKSCNADADDQVQD